MGKYTDDDNNVVTLFNRKKLRPAIDDSQRLESGAVPVTIYFVLPDGAEYAVQTAHDIVIGRQPREDDPPVTVDLEMFDGHDLGVSRHHAMIKQIKDNLVLVDLDSINGTFVNGQRAMPLKRYNIMDGDTITIGRLTLEIRFMKRNHR
ncbi:MAG: FHA domain-containing protein [Phototrophicaceae bacterium]